jgi:AraC-like DNA-binding protein
MAILTNTIILNEIKNIRLNISHFAYAKMNSSWKIASNTYTRNTFFMIIGGEAELFCDGRQVTMTPGNIYVLPKGTVYSVKCSEHINFLYFYASITNSNKDIIPIAPSGLIVLQNRTDTISRMRELYKKPDYRSTFALRVLAEELVLEILERAEEEIPIFNYSPFVRKALHIITTEPHMSHTAASLAAKINISPSRLRNIFSKEIGMSVTKYVRLKVLEAAVDDLENDTLTVKEISNKYGFCDQFYFTRVFTEHFGQPPSKYRKKNI